MTRVRAASIAKEEVARFSAKAEEWWNPEGAFRFLHKMNFVRLSAIEKHVYYHFKRKAEGDLSFRGLRVLDAGCGGGLVAEALARRGAEVTGVDASPEAINVARRHAADSGLAVTYKTGSVESLAAGKARFDVITALEVIEHVADLDSFLTAMARLLNPGGLLVIATLNRTPRSFLFGIVAAEYLLGWVPPGTHDWRKFRRPSELTCRLEALGLEVTDLSGVVFDPITGGFHLDTHNLAVNYLLTAVKVNRASRAKTHSREESN